MRLRVGLVHGDSDLLRSVRRLLLPLDTCALAWQGRDVDEALSRLSTRPADLLLVDPRLPPADVKRLAAAASSQPDGGMLMALTSEPTRDRDRIFQLLGVGAQGSISLDPSDEPGSMAELAAKVVTARRMVGSAASMGSNPKARSAVGPLPLLVAIGSSAGGPGALTELLAQLSPGFSGAIVAVQHLDEQFGENFVAWMRDRSPLTVVPAVAGTAPRPGHVHIAQGPDDLRLNRRGRFSYESARSDSPYHPSVDTFLSSVAEHWRADAAGVVLTGMGRDGADGLLRMRKRGWPTYAQDEASSTVYGMPRAAVAAGAVGRVLTPEAIGRALRTTARRPTGAP